MIKRRPVMGSPAKAGIAAWHGYVSNVSEEALDALLADDVVFQSPVVHTPQEGRAITKLYLMAAFNVFPGEPQKGDTTSEKKESKFRYVREVVGDYDAVLEFETELDGVQVNGVDMIRWNDEGQIIDFKVMVRPLKAIQKVHAQMGAMLEKMKHK
jgi:hypothetical protein